LFIIDKRTYRGEAIMETFATWQDYARDLVTMTLKTGDSKGNHAATVAAYALITKDWERGHPSYYNTQFAVGAFLLPHSLRLYAWRMVVNGLGGYWQWQSHNGGSFSVTEALKHLGLLTVEEATNTHQFIVRETHSGCHYIEVTPSLLARLVKMFALPTTNLEIGGKTNLSEQQFCEREYFKGECFTGGIASDGRSGYEHALRSM
jgi:hypothetical protein